MSFTGKEKRFVLLFLIIAATFALPQAALSMHVMEGYLPLGYCIFWGVITLPFLAIGIISIRRTMEKQKRLMILLAMSGAFIFVLSSLKIPSVTGSCSHMTGTGLAAILFGPFVTSVLGLIVLIFQAILLAHGGLTTLGANTFSMAVAGPFVTYFLYKLGKKMNINSKANIFIAAAVGDLFTYCVTSLQLAVAYPSDVGGVVASAVKFLGVFAPTQLPLSILEGILTVLIVIGLESYAKPELDELAFAEVK